MPANLPPEYFKAEERYLHARTLEEKILATQELIRAAPKHKGTEKLLKMLKRRLSKLRAEKQRQSARHVGGGPSYHVKREGAAQVALVGMPNSGKSTLLRWLTSARPRVASYPFTTRRPVPGMMRFEDIQIQLVEIPAVISGSSLGKGLGVLPLSVARNADAMALVIDVSKDPLGQLKTLTQELEATGIKLNQKPPRFVIRRRATGGIEVRGGGIFEGGEAELKRAIQERHIHNALVIIDEPITAKNLKDALDGSCAYRRAFILATKCTAGGGELGQLKDEYVGKFSIIPVVSIDGDPGEVKLAIFDNLNITRVYTKRPDEEPAKRPVVLPKGSTVSDVAQVVHKDFARGLKFAKVWGSVRFPGQQVPRDYVLQDKDVVELHI